MSRALFVDPRPVSQPLEPSTAGGDHGVDIRCVSARAERFRPQALTASDDDAKPGGGGREKPRVKASMTSPPEVPTVDEFITSYMEIDPDGEMQGSQKHILKEEFIRLCQDIGVGAPKGATALLHCYNCLSQLMMQHDATKRKNLNCFESAFHTTGPVEPFVLMAVFQKAKSLQAMGLTLPQARSAIMEAVDIAGISMEEVLLASPTSLHVSPTEAAVSSGRRTASPVGKGRDTSPLRATTPPVIHQRKALPQEPCSVGPWLHLSIYQKP